MLIALWIGVSTWSSTKMAPTSASGGPSGAPRCTAPTSDPIATANSAGSTPRRMRTTHQAAASAASAFGSTLKNCHSLRARSAVSMSLLAETARRHAGGAMERPHEIRQIAEPGVVGVGGEGLIAAGREARRGAQARREQVLMRRDADDRGENAQEMECAHTGLGGNRRQIDGFLEVSVEPL